MTRNSIKNDVDQESFWSRCSMSTFLPRTPL